MFCNNAKFFHDLTYRPFVKSSTASDFNAIFREFNAITIENLRLCIAQSQHHNGPVDIFSIFFKNAIFNADINICARNSSTCALYAIESTSQCLLIDGLFSDARRNLYRYNLMGGTKRRTADGYFYSTG